MLLKQSIVTLVVALSIWLTKNVAAIKTHDNIVVDPLFAVLGAVDSARQMHENNHRFLAAAGSYEMISETTFVGEFCSNLARVFQTDGLDVTCNCNSRFLVLCERSTPFCESDIASCNNEPVCTTSQFFIYFARGTTRVRAIGGAVDFVAGGPSAYNRTRILLERPKPAQSFSCRAFYVLNGSEYECNSCQVCPDNDDDNDDGPVVPSTNRTTISTVRTNCTNIQPQAIMKSTCHAAFGVVNSSSRIAATTENTDTTTSSDFQLCFPDTPIPTPTITTPGMTPVVFTLSGAATSSTMGTFVLGISIVMGFIGWML